MHLDSLHVAVPAVASGAIGISSGTKEHDDDYWRRLKQFKDMWGTVESIADKGKVRTEERPCSVFRKQKKYEMM